MFKTVQDAFNFYRNKTLAEIETRAQEMHALIETDPNVDIKQLNIELTGLAEAKANAQEKQGDQGGAQGAQEPEARGYNPITGMSFAGGSDQAVKGDVFASAEYRSAFYKTLTGKSLTQAEKNAFNRAMEVEKRAADAYTTSGNTPVIIPTQTLNEIISKARTEGGTLSIARAFNMPSKIAIPVATPSAKAAWHTEGAAVNTEQVGITNVIFDANEIIKIFSISSKVRTMSIDAFEAYLADELTKCIFECIADSLINGTGVGEGMGLEHGVTWVASGAGQNAVQVAAGGSIGYLDVVKAVALLKRGYARRAKWVMNNTTLYTAFYGMVDDNKKPIFVPDPRDETIGKILGFDVVVDDFVADNATYFGDFNYLGYNLANGIAVESSTESSFRSGLIDYRGMAIADTKVIAPEAFVKLSVAPGK